MNKKVMLLGSILALSAFALLAQEKESSKTSGKAGANTTATTEHKIFTTSDMQWGDAPPGLPAGGKMAVLDGDPTKKGSFTVRLQAPDGYKIQPHTHPTAERVTVISGTLHMGMGDKFDEAAMREMAPGSFVVLPARMSHYVRTSGDTVVQIHSEGPFEIKYVNPADDPRTAKK